MKRFLLSLSLLSVIMFANAQVVLNEVYTRPDASTKSEFFELYNTSIGPGSINLDCYSLVVMYATGKNGDQLSNITRGFYIIDFPNVSIDPKGFLVGAAKNPFNVQKQSNVTAAFSWNDLSGTTGSFRKFELQSGSFVEVTNGIPANFNDLFSPMHSAMTIDFAIFLFDNNGKYINGLITSPSQKNGIVPNSITLLPSVTVTTSCGGLSIDWTKLATAEFTGSSDGSDNGFLRKYDGNCGTWDKANSNHTPNASNGTAPSNAVGYLTTSETLFCGNTIGFKITGSTQTSAFPVEVQLYEDNGTIGKLETSDVYLYSYNGPSNTTLLTTTSNNYSYFQNLDASKKYLIVYKTNLGCLDKVAVPSTPTITTTQNSYCGSRVTFTVTGGTVPTPLSVQLYYDTNNNGLYDSGVDQPYSSADPVPVNNYGSSVYTFPNVDPTKKTFVVYSASTYCFISAIVPTAASASGSISTAQTYVCSTTATETSSVNVNITGYSGDATDGNVFPLKAILYYDNTSAGTLGVLDANDTKKDSVTFTQINGPQQTFTIPAADRGQPVIVNYKTAMGCFDKSVALEPSCIVLIGLPVNYASFNAVRKNNTVALTWETASEENNKGFYIQRNTGGDWKDVAFVFSAAANGNSNANLSYAYNDANSVKGASQYRILQVDIDGKGRYSEIRSVRGLEQAAKVVVFPSPSTDKINVMFEDAQSVREVTITDIAGRVVKQYRNVTSNSLSIDNLKDGFYNIQVTDRHTGATVVEKAVMKKR